MKKEEKRKKCQIYLINEDYKVLQACKKKNERTKRYGRRS